MRDARLDLTLASGGGRSSLLTYEPYYGLKEKPFSLSSDPRFLYKSRAHAAVYDDLRAGIRRREGVIVLTGDIGTGKTTLCKAVLGDLDRKTFSTFVPDPFVSREDLLKIVLIDFGVMSVDDLKSGRLNGTSRPALSYPLYEFLQSLVPLQAFAVLVIDEAQNLTLPLLEEIRILSDLEGPEKLLQVVLIGQLELLAKLKDPQMRQLDQRVSVRCELRPLDREGVGGYISHRLSIAGGGTDRVKFADEATFAIYKATKGNPRLINLVCDKALHHGHVVRTPLIGIDFVRQALTELGITQLTPPPRVEAPAAQVAATPPPRRTQEPLDEFGDETASVEPAASGLRTFSSVPDEPQPMFLDEEADEDARASRRTKWIVAGLIGLLAGVLAVGVWQYQQIVASSAALPRFPAAPVHRMAVLRVPDISTLFSGEQALGEYEIGVALFSGPTPARRLEIELAAAGFQASTRARDFASGRMYEVRTGPYRTRADAEIDVARIRQIPGYADARVIPPSTAVR